MNVIWVVADTFRKDRSAAYGRPYIKTPLLDDLAARGTRFDGYYIDGIPTMPTSSDHAAGRWTMSFMGWEPSGDDVTTLVQTLAGADIRTAAVVDTPSTGGIASTTTADSRRPGRTGPGTLAHPGSSDWPPRESHNAVA